MKRSTSVREGLTFIELTVILGIIGIVVVIAILVSRGFVSNVAVVVDEKVAKDTGVSKGTYLGGQVTLEVPDGSSILQLRDPEARLELVTEAGGGSAVASGEVRATKGKRTFILTPTLSDSARKSLRTIRIMAFQEGPAFGDHQHAGSLKPYGRFELSVKIAEDVAKATNVHVGLSRQGSWKKDAKSSSRSLSPGTNAPSSLVITLDIPGGSTVLNYVDPRADIEISVDSATKQNVSGTAGLLVLEQGLRRLTFDVPLNFNHDLVSEVRVSRLFDGK